MDSKLTENFPLSPRFVAAIFFAIFAFVFTLFTKYILLSLQQTSVLPLFPSIVFAIFLAGLLGNLYGRTLVKRANWLRSFLLGASLACLALIIASGGLFTHYYLHNSAFFSQFHRWQDYFVLYGALLLSLSVTVGLWLIPFTGLIAIYFNKYFWPRLIATIAKENNK